jgi:triphosphoribosyl-dephospho-CoA synthase
VTAALASRPSGAPASAAAGPAADEIGRAATAALLEELRVHPKPGLVSPIDPGAHADMDAGTFLRSLRALRPAFGAMARAGMTRAPFAVLRELGARAEAEMLRATGGVNTHRGAIFTHGLLAAGAGRLAAGGAPASAAALRATVRGAFAPALRELPRPRRSHGAVVLRRHGVGGARAEALAGFPHLFEVALPALSGSLAAGAPRRAAAVQCLLATIAVLPDTNLLYRGGARGLAFARGAARAFLAGGGVHRPGWEREARDLHREFTRRRLSPGGSADLLAAALLVLRLSAPESGGPRPEPA